MTAKLKVRACVFDAYGTLFDVTSPVAKLASEIGPHADDVSRLWRQKQLEYSWLRSLMGVHADFWHVTGDALDYALEQYGVSEPGLRDEIMALYGAPVSYEDDAYRAVQTAVEMFECLDQWNATRVQEGKRAVQIGAMCR